MQRPSLSCLLAAMLLAACAINPQAAIGPGSSSSRVYNASWDRPDWNDGIFGPELDRVREFAAAVGAAAQTGGAERLSVGVFPLAYLDRTKPSGEWRVTEAGVLVAEELSQLLENTVEPTTLFYPSALGVQLADLSIEPTVLRRARDVRASGQYVGVDILLFGSLQLESIGASTARRLVGEVEAIRVGDGQRISRARWEVSGCRPSARQLFASIDRESEWRCSEGLQLLPHSTFDQDLKAALNLLGKRATRVAWCNEEEERPPTRTIVASADAAEILLDAKEARSLHGLVLAERARRSRDAALEQRAPDLNAPFQLDGRLFDSLAAAEIYVAGKLDTFEVSEAQSLCVMVGDGVRLGMQVDGNREVKSAATVIPDDDVRVLKTRVAECSLGEDESMVRMLKEHEIGRVVLPLIESRSGAYSVRLRIVDVSRPNDFTSVSFPLDPRFASDLALALGEARDSGS